MPTERTSSGQVRPLLLVTAAALLLRLAWIVSANVAPDEGFHFDMTWYHGMGLRIAAGDGMTRLTGAATAEWPPGYPLLLAAVYTLSGGSVVAAQVVNAILATVTCVAVYAIASSLFGASTGLLSALLLAICPGDVYYSALLLSEVAFGAALTVSCLLFSKLDSPGTSTADTVARYVVIGVALGATTLIRGASLAFPLVFALVWLARSRSPRFTAGRLALVFAGMLVALAPWALRNQIMLGSPVFVSNSLGRTLAHAHAEHVTGRRSRQAMDERVAFWKSFEHIPQPRREIEINRRWIAQSLRYMVSHPARELGLVPVRLGNFYGSDHAALEWGRRRGEAVGGGQMQPLVAGVADRVFEILADAYFYALLVLGAAGVWIVCRCHGPAALLIPGAIGYFTLLHAVVLPGEPRYHHPVVPFLAIAAAVGLNRLSRSTAEPART